MKDEIRKLIQKDLDKLSPITEKFIQNQKNISLLFGIMFGLGIAAFIFVAIFI